MFLSAVPESSEESTTSTAAAAMACVPDDPSTPPAGGLCMWNKLPPKLMGLIYDIAYVPIDKVRPYQLITWEEEEDKRKRREKSKFKPGKFSRPRFIERLLVSKEWCKAALDLYYSRAHFDFERLRDALHFVTTDEHSPRSYTSRITTLSLTIDWLYTSVPILTHCKSRKKTLKPTSRTRTTSPPTKRLVISYCKSAVSPPSPSPLISNRGTATPKTFSPPTLPDREEQLQPPPSTLQNGAGVLTNIAQLTIL